MEIFPIFGFIEVKNVLIIIHLLGVALGVGGAIMSDFMFIKSARDKLISKVEMSFLTLGSTFVWAGLALLVISGAMMFFLNPEQYATSSKFLTKMTVIGFLVINAIVFHALHIPRIKKSVGEVFSETNNLIKYRTSMLVSGVISIISWVYALILGTLSSIPYPYIYVLGLYLIFLLLGLLVAYVTKDHFISKK